jgi:hypothetical protein
MAVTFYFTYLPRGLENGREPSSRQARLIIRHSVITLGSKVHLIYTMFQRFLYTRAFILWFNL